MPTLPLYISPPSPNAWHRVLSPGGYERWHFDAEDPASDTRVIIDFFDGLTYDREYLRRYHAYRRRPTRHAPPTAREYPAVYVAASRAGKTILERTLRLPPGACSGSVEKTDVTIGRHRLSLGDAGQYQLHLEDADVRLRADLTFAPRVIVSTTEPRIFSQGGAVREHFWLIPAPLCDVTGMLRYADAQQFDHTIEFRGRGYHDHYFGTAPLAYGLQLWLRGRVLLEGRALMFEVTARQDHYTSMLLEADALGISEMTHHDCEVGPINGTAPEACPQSIACDAFQLTKPQLLGTASGARWLTYAARLPDGRIATALCEVALR